jgi:anti-sigma factor ChrR (cupin superfamily)
VPPPALQWSEPEWEQVAPGIECKLLATDTERHRISMLVRLAPGASYPAHIHAGNEELHLLAGERTVVVVAGDELAVVDPQLAPAFSSRAPRTFCNRAGGCHVEQTK